ncbi:nucleoside diphosphate kinase regulator [Azospirillum halopraeferens]|uniref:nucleoside diphosphate kinase regulator n=1 Tax=Azospirillum halopraeferens TaxID=34010 RepID=UPI00040A2F39|nr:nucleoside diphosphate kinase regulator [Azospirillum halopraeferens]
MTTTPRRSRLPAITLTRAVHARLSELAFAVADRLPDVAEYLERELERAGVVEEGALPAATVTIGSLVTFVDRDTGQRHGFTLVWPGDEDAARHRLSVMTPVGAALIGLRAGQSIDWMTRTGAWRRLSVEAVSPPGDRKTGAVP